MNVFFSLILRPPPRNTSTLLKPNPGCAAGHDTICFPKCDSFHIVFKESPCILPIFITSSNLTVPRSENIEHILLRLGIEDQKTALFSSPTDWWQCNP